MLKMCKYMQNHYISLKKTSIEHATDYSYLVVVVDLLVADPTGVDGRGVGVLGKYKLQFTYCLLTL